MQKPSSQQIDYEDAILDGFYDEESQEVAAVETVAADDFRDIDAEESDEERRERWERDWSRRYQDSDADCEELDRIYAQLSAGYKSVTDPRVLFNLRKVCMLELEQDKAIAAGDDARAKRCSEMIKTVFDLEGMRATDQKPMEAGRPDALITSLEQRGAITNGWFLDMPSVVRYIDKDKGKYRESLDGIDTLMFLCENARRVNSGMTELTELPKALQLADTHKEFEKKLTPRERENFSELGIIPPVRAKGTEA